MRNPTKLLTEIIPKNFIANNFVYTESLPFIFSDLTELQEDYIYLAEFEADIQAILHKPSLYRFDLIDECGQPLLPDFLIRYLDRSKLDRLIFINDDLSRCNHFDLTKSLSEISRYCKNKCLTFSVLTKEDFTKKQIFIKNIKFLSAYSNLSGEIFGDFTVKQREWEYLKAITEFLKIFESTTIERLIVEVVRDKSEIEMVRSCICFLLYKRFIRYNADLPLSNKSKIWTL